ncbi:hypothetical protein HJC23_003899 [Cyclotella cryptica]|uniref:Uncharacterized protein n=1 Tax=Cyclotella cryptica TaxID=29204 RepID=A0ABD3PFI6_9STRA|eukprot:CCRYP_015574-RA/>CCRYP_015574-RA protein AED:0.12 eAED:0.12 QI:0/-1/0/1/-1/1/1/0/674
MAASLILNGLLMLSFLSSAASSMRWQRHVDNVQREPESSFQIQPPSNNLDLHNANHDEIYVGESGHRFLNVVENRETTYTIKQLEHDDSPNSPSEILIEILYPKPPREFWYSVTIVSQGRYSGTATLLGDAPNSNVAGMRPLSLVYSWKPNYGGKYEVIVHELPQNPVGNPVTEPLKSLDPTSFKIGMKPGVPIGPWAVMESKMKTLPPCSTVDRTDVYTNWDGSWIGPRMPTSSPEGRLRNDWFFLPSEEMNCKIETYTPDDFRFIPEEKSIYILGNSKERGIFLSLVDLLLDSDEKKDIQESVIAKCWGRAFVQKSNLKVLYQDWRSDNFDTRSNDKAVVCHNEKVAREGGPLFFGSGIKVWSEIFQDRSQWPSVILMSTGNDMGFKGQMYDINEFVKRLPPNWKGKLLLTDGAFSARLSGRGYASDYEVYRAKLRELTAFTNDPRVRWVDGMGLSKEMRMYGEAGPDHTSYSQHFHAACDVPYVDVHGNAQSMRICSNVTENIAQLLIGHAVGPKDQLLKAEDLPPEALHVPQQAMYCHACPEELLPFHITPYPDMTCSVGALHPRTKNEVTGNHQVCPKECMSLEVKFTKGSQSDVIHERHCPIEFFPLGFSVGSDMPMEVQRALGEEEIGSLGWFMDVWFYSSFSLLLLFGFRNRLKINSLVRLRSNLL